MSDTACPIRGCETPKRPGDLCCRRHWYQVPGWLRRQVWHLWRHGSIQDWLERHAAWERQEAHR